MLKYAEELNLGFGFVLVYNGLRQGKSSYILWAVSRCSFDIERVWFLLFCKTAKRSARFSIGSGEEG